MWNADFTTLLRSECVEYVDEWEISDRLFIASFTSDVAIHRNERLDGEKQLREMQVKMEEVKAGKLIRTDPEVDEDGFVVQRTLTVDELKEQIKKMEERLTLLLNRRKYSYSAIDPSAILGVSTSIIPLPNHNQAPRNTYQSSMGKQANGVYHSNHLGRFDSLSKVLAAPQRPIFEPQMNRIIGLDERPSGQNLLTAIIADPYNPEDAFVVKKGAVDRGLGMYIKYNVYTTSLKVTSEYIERFERPPTRPGESVTRCHAIDENGLPILGSKLSPGNWIIGKTRQNRTTGLKENISISMPVGDYGTIDRIFIGYNSANERFIRVKIRDVRSPTVGDKLASRHAQKGTISTIRPDVDMPFIGGENEAFQERERKRVEWEKDLDARSERINELSENPASFDDKKQKELVSKVVERYQRRNYHDKTTPEYRAHILFLHACKSFLTGKTSWSEWLKLFIPLEVESIQQEDEAIHKQRMEEKSLTGENQHRMAGLQPDIIINPHSIPSRMTMAKMIEFIAGMSGALTGRIINATAFRPVDIEELGQILQSYGLASDGAHVMYDGRTGRALQGRIFVGLVYYQFLRHTVLDKIQARREGTHTKSTRQPVGGRAVNGGQRLGEMERDGIISHGASSVLLERMCYASDAFPQPFCLNCGTMSNRVIDNKTECRNCGQRGQFHKLIMPYAYKLVLDLLLGAGFAMKFQLTTEQTARRSYMNPKAVTLQQVVDDEEEDEEAKGEKSAQEGEDIDEYDEGGVYDVDTYESTFGRGRGRGGAEEEDER
jgi:DNA-directed RNA polymerase beta subunit